MHRRLVCGNWRTAANTKGRNDAKAQVPLSVWRLVRHLIVSAHATKSVVQSKKRWTASLVECGSVDVSRSDGVEV